MDAEEKMEDVATEAVGNDQPAVAEATEEEACGAVEPADEEEYGGEEADGEVFVGESGFGAAGIDDEGADDPGADGAADAGDVDDVEGADAESADDADEEEAERLEMEIDEDDIYAYIVDENDREIGFILLDENGEEQEFYYADDEQEGSSDNEFDLGISREGVAAATADMNAIYRDGAQVAAELKSTFDEISESLNFLKKKK